MTSIDKTIEYCAQEMAKVMREDGFDTFSEMAKCYMWDSADIREELSFYADELKLAYIDEVDYTLVIGNDGADMEYKAFAAAVKKMANKLVKEA